MPGTPLQTVIVAVNEPRNRAGRVLLRLLPWIEIASCAMLAGLLMWKGILPGWRFLNTDFPNYYLVARLLREGYALDRIYDWVWLQRIKDHWGLDQPLVGFAGLTPFSALPIVPFSFFSALVAKRLWIVANLLLLGASIELMGRVTSLGRRRLWMLCLLAVFPLRTSFLLGQMHLLVLFLLVAAYFLRRRGKQVGCAVCLSAAGFLKVYPLLFLFYFLWKRQWRQAAAMLCAVLFLLGVSYLWIGSDSINIYLTQVLPRSLQGEVLDPYSLHAASVAALFHRLFIFEPSLNPTPLVHAPWLYTTLYPLWQLLILLPLLALLQEKESHSDAEQVEWAAYLFALLVLSPVPASYHFVVMIVPMILLVDHLLLRAKFKSAALSAGLYSAVSLIELVPFDKRASGGIILAFGRVWIELLLLGMLLFCLWQARGNRKTRPANTLRLAALSVVAVMVWTAGAVGYHHHFKHLQQDLSRRMLPATSAYLSTGIRQNPDGYLTTAMETDGYRVLDQQGQNLWKNAPGEPYSDQLSAALSQGAPGALVELAGKTGSSLVAVPFGGRFRAFQNPQPFLADAESPAISPGGTAVAFIREVKGHGTLWFARMEQPLGRLQSEPVALTKQDYDVRDVTFANSDWLLFTARVNGHTSIFSMNSRSQPKAFLSEAQDVTSAAVSADERLVAFTKLLHGRWQLGYMNVATGHEEMLTFGDCNAYSPAWTAPATITYATDCGRGLGLSALAAVSIERDFIATRHP